MTVAAAVVETVVVVADARGVVAAVGDVPTTIAKLLPISVAGLSEAGPMIAAEASCVAELFRP